MQCQASKQRKRFLKYTSRPTHITHKIFAENYAPIQETKPVSMLSKPIYGGFFVLELSNWLMYDFNFSFVKKHFDAEFLFTDTDSLTYEINKKMFMKNFLSTRTCFISVTIQRIQNFLIQPMKKLLVK